MEAVPYSRENIAIDMFSNRKIYDLEYADYPVLLIEDPNKLFFAHPRSKVNKFKICCASPKCKILLRKLTGSKLILVIARKWLDEVDRFNEWGNWITRGGRTSDEVSCRLQRVSLVFIILRHLRARQDIQMFAKGHV